MTPSITGGLLILGIRKCGTCPSVIPPYGVAASKKLQSIRIDIIVRRTVVVI
jgi:hypothetical protein